MSIFSPRWRRFSRGFTLIELMVVISIMVIVTALVLVRQSRFNSSTVLRSLAYSIALSVRQAQVYGSSVLGTAATSANCTGGSYSSASGVCYANAYGVNFTTADAQHYYLFADLDANGCRSGDSFTCPGVGTAGAEDVKTFALSSNFTITNLCVYDSATSQAYCSASCPANLFSGASCTPSQMNALTIVFHRPNPEACITDDVTPSCGQGASSPFTKAYIQIDNPADPGNTRSITVTQTGEISVCALSGC